MINDRRILENAIPGIEMRQSQLIQERAHLNQMLEELDGRKAVGRPKLTVNGAEKKPKRIISVSYLRKAVSG